MGSWYRCLPGTESPGHRSSFLLLRNSSTQSPYGCENEEIPPLLRNTESIHLPAAPAYGYPPVPHNSGILSSLFLCFSLLCSHWFPYFFISIMPPRKARASWAGGWSESFFSQLTGRILPKDPGSQIFRLRGIFHTARSFFRNAAAYLSLQIILPLERS